MQSHKLLLPIFIAAVTSTGCTTIDGLKDRVVSMLPQQEVETDQAVIQPSESQQTIGTKNPNRRDAIVELNTGKRGGAAIRPEERQHVLYWNDADEITQVTLSAARAATLNSQDLVIQGLERLDTMDKQGSDSTAPLTSSGNEGTTVTAANGSSDKDVITPIPATTAPPTQSLQASSSQPDTAASLAQAALLNSAVKANSEATGLSVYELARWERYCEGTPNNQDMAFIKRVGGHSMVPAHLASNCSPSEQP